MSSTLVIVRLLFASVGITSLLLLQMEGEEVTVSAPPYGESSCCKSSNCTSAIHLEPDGDSWKDGCSTDAAGNCTGECFRCTGVTSSADLCYYDPTGECYATENAWQTFACGTKDKYKCKSGGGGPSSCCSDSIKLTPTMDACAAYKCAMDPQSTHCPE